MNELDSINFKMSIKYCPIHTYHALVVVVFFKKNVYLWSVSEMSFIPTKELIEAAV